MESNKLLTEKYKELNQKYLIFYKGEVIKKYPKATLDYMKKKPFKSIWDANLEFWINDNETNKYITLSDICNTELEAWESAYNRLALVK